MLEILSNIYVLPIIIVVCSLVLMNVYMRVMRSDEESNKGAYFKCGVSVYLTSLATLMLYQKVCPVSLQSGGGVKIYTPTPVMPENFNVGRVPF